MEYKKKQRMKYHDGLLSTHSDISDMLSLIPACFFYYSSQLGLILPLRDEEMFPQRLRAEAAVSEHQLPPQDGGTHHPSQSDAEVRSEL